MRKIIFCILFGFIIYSCEKSIVLENTPENVFEVFWHTINDRYVNFDIRDVNWDDIYTQYAPRFRAAKSETELKNLFRELANILEDSHVAILYPRDPARNMYNSITYNPWKDYHTLFEIDIERYGFELRIDRFPYRIYQHSTKGYVYLSYRSFNGQFDKKYFMEVLNELDYSEGLVIDVSMNGGGMSDHCDELASLFFDDNGTWYYQLFRKGVNHNSFTSPQKVHIRNNYSPQGWVPLTDVPLMLLTSFSTHSAGVIFSFHVSENPNLLSIGHSTSKGGDSVKSIYLPNGWLLSYPSIIKINKYKEEMRGGFIPNIETPYIHGRDSIPVIVALEYLDSINNYQKLNYRVLSAESR